MFLIIIKIIIFLDTFFNEPKDDIPFISQRSLNHQSKKKIILHLPFDYKVWIIVYIKLEQGIYVLVFQVFSRNSNLVDSFV